MAEQRKPYTAALKHAAVRLGTEHRGGMAETARNLGMHVHRLRRWKQADPAHTPAAFPGHGRGPPEPAALRPRRGQAVTQGA